MFMKVASLIVLERKHTSQFLVKWAEKIRKQIKEDLKYTQALKYSQISKKRL